MKREAYAPLIIASVLLLLVLYVGSYLALVKPYHGPYLNFPDPPDYRWGGSWSACAFWPLEQIDRRLRPGFWIQERVGGVLNST